MKKSILILIASTAMVANFGVPAWSGMINKNDPVAGYSDKNINTDLPFILASSDEDDDDDDYRSKKRRYSDDDDDRYSDDDDNRSYKKKRKGAKNSAPAGTMTPPKNGLFNN